MRGGGIDDKTLYPHPSSASLEYCRERRRILYHLESTPSRSAFSRLTRKACSERLCLGNSDKRKDRKSCSV